MVHLAWILLCGTLCILHSHSYVLLTANVEDVQSIAHQVANSPLLDQLKNVWRRASKTFQKTLNSPKMRSDDQVNLDNHKNDDNSNTSADAKQDDNVNLKTEDHPAAANGHEETRAARREAVEQLMNLGRNASVYLGSIKQIIDKI